MDIKERILQIIRIKGPVVPSDISKEINLDILMTSAYLSELTSQKKLKISNLKVGGGSPLYYYPGQESRLQEFSDKLNEKNRQAFDYLKKNRVLRDSELSPLMRVSLREIKDFSKPLEVISNNRKEIFWKWYLIDNKEAGDMIKEKLGIIKTPEKEQTEHIAEEKQPEGLFMKLVSFGKKKEETAEKPEKEEIKPDEIELKAEKIKDKIKDKINHKIQEPEKDISGKQDMQKKLENDEVLSAWKEKQSPFIDLLKEYFNKKNIKVVEINIIRKDTDIELILELDSSIGSIIYFCKAKNKKKVNDGDLTSAFFEGQTRKLPSMLIITGSMTKKAESMLSKGLKGLSIVKI